MHKLAEAHQGEVEKVGFVIVKRKSLALFHDESVWKVTLLVNDLLMWYILWWETDFKFKC